MNVRVFQFSKILSSTTRGVLETVRTIAEMYGSMSLVELDGYFEGLQTSIIISHKTQLANWTKRHKSYLAPVRLTKWYLVH